MRILNLAIPIMYLFGFTLGVVIYALIAQLFISLGLSQKSAEVIGGWGALIVIIGLSCAIANSKIKTLRSPTKDTASGHMLLAIGNAGALLSTIVPIALSYFSKNNDNMFYLWYSIPIIFFSFIFWITGWKGATSSDY